MSIVSGIVVFTIIWWLVFFIVLSIGVRPPENPETGHASSAPENPKMGMRFLITTGISILLSILAYFLLENYFHI